MNFLKNVPKTVFVLGLVSLFTDVSTEMTYPLLPLFLSQVLGAGPFALGLIEGVAETTASVLKVFSGVWTDRLKRHKPLVVLGYGLSGFFRPFIGLAQVWPVVLVLRFIDRVGKGIRSSPRDALIADITSPSNRGASFGFHSSMDNLGSMIGPFIATLLLLPFIGFSIRTVILLTAVPGLAAWLILVWGVGEKKPKPGKERKGTLNFRADWKKLGGGFKKLLFALLVFTLGNSTDAFLLLRLTQVGVAAAYVPILWGLHGGVRMVSALYGGRLSDTFGRKIIILSGWAFYALVYFSFAYVSQPAAVIAVFLVYGVFYGLCEPSEKALVADLAPQNLRGTAYGYYNLVVGLGALPASLLFGFVGQTWGYPAAFVVGALFAGLATVLLATVKKDH
ncbi:MAG TPA: MFS transporter [bacterium]|nr:MFS transporter [bacterium]